MKNPMKIAFMGILAVVVATNAFGYTNADFLLEKDTLLSNQNCMLRDGVSGFAVIKTCLPVMTSSETLVYSVDLSFTETVAPFYVYGIPNTNFALFSNFVSNYGANGDSIKAANIGLSVAFPFRLQAGITFSYLPTMSFGTASYGLFKVGVNGYYRLLDEKFAEIGLLIGAGYSYLSGSASHALTNTYTDSLTNTVSYNGTLASVYDYHTFNLELFVHKTLFIINFYGKLGYNYSIGQVNSSLRGTYIGVAADYSATNNNAVSGMVLSAGMELALGFFKINAEAGRNWFTSSVYGNIGFRFEM